MIPPPTPLGTSLLNTSLLTIAAIVVSIAIGQTRYALPIIIPCYFIRCGIETLVASDGILLDILGVVYLFVGLGIGTLVFVDKAGVENTWISHEREDL